MNILIVKNRIGIEMQQKTSNQTEKQNESNFYADCNKEKHYEEPEKKTTNTNENYGCNVISEQDENSVHMRMVCAVVTCMSAYLQMEIQLQGITGIQRKFIFDDIN